jgi:hypothetical protein
MSTTTETRTEPGRYVEPTYGGWAKPQAPGIAGQGLVGTLILLAGLVVTIVATMVAGIAAGAVCAVGVVVVLAPLTIRVGGRSAGQWLLARTVFGSATRAKRTVYVSGPGSVVPTGTHQLPGLLAPVACHEVSTPAGEVFALLEHPAPRGGAGAVWTVVFACQPEGSDLVDAPVLDNRVAGWGGFLASLARTPEVIAAQQVVEVIPDPGTRLAAEVARLTDPDAPPIARAALAEAAATMPTGQAVLVSRCSVTFATPRGVAARKKPERAAAMGEYVARFLPGLAGSLSSAGAGPVALLAPGELAEDLRMAYNPAASAAIERARAAGEPTRVAWEDAGPSGATESWDAYAHDDAVSITWAMTTAPAGEVVRDALAGLFVPDPEALRRRVCLTYRPHRPDTARLMARRSARNALWRAGQPGVGDAGDDLAVNTARQAQRELARGAGLVSFSLHVTATVTRGGDLAQAAANVEQAASGAEIGLRRCYGHQAAAFTAALGVGVVPAMHLRIPEAIRRNL